MLNEDALVLFDIDGTLLCKSGPHHREALQAGILREMRIHATTDGIDTAGTLDRDLIRLMLKGAQIPEHETAGALERIVEACEQSYVNNCNADLRSRVCPGAAELLGALTAAGVTIGVVTGNLQAIGWRKLELAGLREHFHVGAFSQDGPTRAHLAKKASERAAEWKGTQPRQITLIGDHRNDIAAAKSNGFRSIAVATGVLNAEQLWQEEPDLVVADMTELSLKNIFGQTT